MLTYNADFKPILEKKYSSVAQYICETGMDEQGTWGEDVELQALSTLTNTEVQVYTKDGWLNTFKPFPICDRSDDFTLDQSNIIEGERIYLAFLNEHYESINSV